MIHVPNSSDIYVRLGALEFGLCHELSLKPSKITPSYEVSFDALSLYLRNYLFSLRLGYFLIVGEFHRVNRAALAHRPERRRVAEHLRQRHAGGDDMRIGALRHATDLAAPRREIADHVA